MDEKARERSPKRALEADDTQEPQTPSPSSRRRRRISRTATATEVRQVDVSSGSSTDTEVEQEPEEDEEEVATPDNDDEEEFSVISSDASPHDSVFEFLSLHPSESGTFCLFTPSPAASARRQQRPVMLSSPLRHREDGDSTTAFSSPSHFFRSPYSTGKRRAARLPTTRLQTYDEEKEEKEGTDDRQQRTSDVAIKEEEPHQEQDDDDDDLRLRTPVRGLGHSIGATPQVKQELMEDLLVPHILSPWPRSNLFLRTPSPPSKGLQLSRQLKHDFDREEDNEDSADEERRNMNDNEDLYSAPSGLRASLGDPEGYFSFANSLSPLVHAEEFETSFMPVRLSPLVHTASCELPRLIPPFPIPKLDEETLSREGNDEEPVNKQIHSTPKIPISLRGSTSSYSSSSSSSSATTLLSESFPNIRASTSATPGKDERLKIGRHTVMTMKLHAALESSILPSHSQREMQAINNSLKRKSNVRKRKLEAKGTTSGVQRKLLQTPLKASPLRSPLHPWNGRIPRQFQQRTPRTPNSPQSAVARQLLSPSSATPNKMRRFSTTTVSATLESTPSSLSATAAFAALKLKKTSTTARSLSTGSLLSASRTASASHTPSKTSGAGRTPSRYSMESGISPLNDSLVMTPLPKGQGPSVNLLVTTSPMKTKKAPCNCKKSKCLKLYCECFASGGYCDASCNCVDCANIPATEAARQQAIAARLEKNPNAFKPKIAPTTTILGAGTGVATPSRIGTPGATFTTPMGTHKVHLGNGVDLKKMHKHGCHCKKSACQKKYCECFQAGVPCGDNCRCIDCKNQLPSLAHASDASPAIATKSRFLNDVDDTFLSPMLQTVRQRLRIDRETWTKNFSSPFEDSPRRERERTERFRSQMKANTMGRAKSSGLSIRFGATADQSTSSKISGSLSRSVSPLPESLSDGDSDRPVGSVLSRLEAMKQRKRCRMLDSSSSGTFNSPTSISCIGDRVVVLPLFGEHVPPLKTAVSAQIFHYLTNADLYNASLVNRLWSQVTLGDLVWDHANFVKANVDCNTDSQNNEERSLIVLQR